MKGTLIILLFFSTLAGSSKDKSYHCFWREKGEDVFMTRAGDFKYSEDGMFYYCISNDKDNIYINIKIFDPNIQRIVSHSGMTIWINDNGKKEKKTGIKFPSGQINQGANNEEGQRSQDFKNFQPEKGQVGSENIDANSILLFGFSESGPILVSALEKDNFRGSIKFKSDQYLYYELILPKAKLSEISDSDRKENKLAIGFSHGPNEMSNWKNIGNEGSGGMRGGRGGMRGGGMSGGGHHRGMSGNPGSQAYSNSITGEFWLKDVILAEGK